jgi:hypothetical protein
MASPTNPPKALMMTAKIRDIKARILINSGCLSNFMSPDFVEKAQLHTQVKEYQYTLYGIDNQPVTENGGIVAKKITPISIDIQGH